MAQIAGAGRNRSSYVLLNYRHDGLGPLQQLFIENNLRRVRDDIADAVGATNEIPLYGLIDGVVGLHRVTIIPGRTLVPFFVPVLQPDPMRYRDSYVNETYLETRLRLGSTFNMVQKLRLMLNWQQGGRLHQGLYQRSRRLDFWTWVGRADYTYQWGKLQVTPQYKFLLLRQVDREQDQALRSEWRSIPILRLEYLLMRRTLLRAGIQGLGALPYRREDSVSRRESFEQRTVFATLTNHSRYFGYQLVTIAGFSRDRKAFDVEFQRFRERDGWELFVRALIGFAEFGRPI